MASADTELLDPPTHPLPTAAPGAAEHAPSGAGRPHQIASEMARDASAAAARDAELEVVRGLLRDALEALATVRHDALGAA